MRIRKKIVEEGNWWKFTSENDGGALGKKLLETGERELVEVRGVSANKLGVVR